MNSKSLFKQASLLVLLSFSQLVLVAQAQEKESIKLYANVLPMPVAWELYKDITEKSYAQKTTLDINFPPPFDSSQTTNESLKTNQPLNALLENDFIRPPIDRPRGQWQEKNKAALILPTTILQANFIVEADYSLYQLLGNSEAAVRTYVANLLSTISAIYETDVKVRIRASQVRVWTKPDPWSMLPDSSTVIDKLREHWIR